MDILIIVISAVVASAIVGYVTYMFTYKSTEKRRTAILKEAEQDSEMLKKEKILQAKEKFLQMKAEHEKQVTERNSRIAQIEAKIKQRESQLQGEADQLAKKNKEFESTRTKVESELEGIDRRKEELERLRGEQIVKLEQISGLSIDQAKEQLVEQLKGEARTQAMSYVNDIIDEAKMTANKEAKKIVVQSIQRVATEAAIENSVTVFNIDSDEVKGRIIGREGRNIRALEAATGIEIIVDDTPEAIILSGFDPVRREIARLALHQLVTDGRIHPARIEEVVTKVQKQIEEEIGRAHV